MKNLFLFSFLIFSVSGAPSRSLEENPDLFEGDILLRKDRNGLIGDQYLWPNVTVVYELDSAFNAADLARIWSGWADISNTTCIKFRVKGANDTDFVKVVKGEEGSGCFSEVGRIGGEQVLNMEPRCLDRHGTIIHEMLHAIGFYHEQSRPDRDDYVEVAWDKIQPGLEHNFEKYNTSEVTTFGAPYDYGSVLHYPTAGFSIDGTPTLVPKIPGVEIGQRTHISEIDAGKVRLMYSCPDEW